jgi:hypothetical protein
MLIKIHDKHNFSALIARHTHITQKTAEKSKLINSTNTVSAHKTKCNAIPQVLQIYNKMFPHSLGTKISPQDSILKIDVTHTKIFTAKTTGKTAHNFLHLRQEYTQVITDSVHQTTRILLEKM